MSDWKISLYQKMPPTVRDWIATARGYYLRSWRYGAETERLVEEALERDSWSAEQWKVYQENRLAYVLHRARNQVPYYRNLWDMKKRQGDNTSSDYLENWPVLKKESLRRSTEAFVADELDIKKMYLDNTSGTTGTPLSIYSTQSTIRQWYALFEARCRRWYGLNKNENWAILGGQPVIPANTKNAPFWVWNGGLNQLYLSANHVSEQNVEAYVQALQDYQISHIVAYTSSVTYLAEQILKASQLIQIASLRAIITNAEPLYDWQRSILEQAFQTSVYETYGMGEIVAAASADSSRRLRLWPEPGFLEVFDDDADLNLAKGQVGRLICTSLLNADMPLIRYEVGDRSGISSGQIDSHDPIQSPILLAIQGRNNDMLIAKDGRRVFWLNPIFYQLPIVEAQIQQDSLNEILIRYVVSADFDKSILLEIEKRLINKMGDITVHFQQMDYIPRSASGKFRAVINQLSAEELARVKTI